MKVLACFLLILTYANNVLSKSNHAIIRPYGVPDTNDDAVIQVPAFLDTEKKSSLTLKALQEALDTLTICKSSYSRKYIPSRYDYLFSPSFRPPVPAIPIYLLRTLQEHENTYAFINNDSFEYAGKACQLCSLDFNDKDSVLAIGDGEAEMLTHMDCALKYYENRDSYCRPLNQATQKFHLALGGKIRRDITHRHVWELTENVEHCTIIELHRQVNLYTRCLSSQSDHGLYTEFLPLLLEVYLDKNLAKEITGDASNYLYYHDLIGAASSLLSKAVQHILPASCQQASGGGTVTMKANLVSLALKALDFYKQHYEQYPYSTAVADRPNTISILKLNDFYQTIYIYGDDDSRKILSQNHEQWLKSLSGSEGYFIPHQHSLHRQGGCIIF